MRFAWIENNSIRDIAPGNPSEFYHPDIAKLYDTQVPDDAVNGATLIDGAWTNPAPPPAPEPQPPGPKVYASLTPMEFYLAFSPQERIAIKSSQDAVVKEFWETYQIAKDLKNNIDPNLSSVVGGLEYLRGLGILASDDRIESIRSGTAV